jgi:hypothetical protein
VVWPKNHWDNFLWFGLKSGGDGFHQFGLKTSGDGFLRFGLKINCDVSPGLASKLVVEGFSIWVSKPAATVW